MPKLSVRGYITALPHYIRDKVKRDKISYYIAENLRLITENTAKSSGGQYLSVKLEDVLNPKPIDTRTADEIAADIIKKAGLNFGSS